MRILFAFCLGLMVLACSDEKNHSPGFTLMQPSETGIDFINNVTYSREFNIFNYRNFFNGGGVAIGDINNDGLADVFFTSNQGQNKLYQNLGNWQFKDVTLESRIGSKQQWHTGVTMTDINADGWLDIYVCNSGEVDNDTRSNELFINQGDGTFVEEAAKYGLDDRGLGTHAAFFDFDHDGDLDCYVLNNSYKPIESFGYDKSSYRRIRNDEGGDRLYRNDNGHFVDVSQSAGIFGSEIGFGLGISVADLNNDGWEDIYISNDFFERDYLYLNQQNGSFIEAIESSMGHISLSSMGSDIIDVNNDGNLDVFTTDMLPEGDYRLKTTTKFEEFDVHNAKLKNDFHHQFMSNCLQLNNGDGTYSEVAAFAGIEATDWSWGALGFDFDNDGWKDIFVSNGILKDLTNQDFLTYFGSDVMMRQARSGTMDFKRVLDEMPSVPISNYAFVNKRNLRFENQVGPLGLDQTGFSNGAAYGDLDNDGDLDLVVNNVNQVAFVYRNQSVEKSGSHFLRVKLRGSGTNTQGIGARVMVYEGKMMQTTQQMPGRGFQSSVDPVLHFGIGNATRVDSLVVLWPDLKTQTIVDVKIDTLMTLNQKDAHVLWTMPSRVRKPLYRNVTDSVFAFRHLENAFIDFDVERLIPKALSADGPKVCKGDFNGDSLEDLFIGSSSGDTSRVFLQNSEGGFSSDIGIAFVLDREYEDAGVVAMDLEPDGDLDLIVSSGGNQFEPGSRFQLVRVYLNDGDGKFGRSFKNIPGVYLNASCLTLIDFDADGKRDIFIGGRSITNSYGLVPASVLLKNVGGGQFRDVTATHAPALQRLGMVTDAKAADLDGDGKQELVVVGDWMPVTVLRFNGRVLLPALEVRNSSGWWNCLEIEDLDSDGDLDFVAGNLGSNSKIRADVDHPAKLFTADFDKNGKTDCLAQYYKSDGKPYLFNLKDDLIRQLPGLKKKYLRYDSYAGKSINEIFTNGELGSAEVLQVVETRTCIFINDGGGGFTMSPLPTEAQLSSVHSIFARDLNGDKKVDLFLAGNLFGLKPEVGRCDASYGVTLLSGDDGQFASAGTVGSGLFIKGEVRDIEEMNVSGVPHIFVARNNDSIQVFKR